jgi:RNA polymerase sigma factor (sigma-70 family)
VNTKVIEAERMDEGKSSSSTKSFEEIVHQHGRLVFHVCRSILGNDHDAEDAFQATFLVFIQRSREGFTPDSTGSWLCGVATRISLRAKQRRSRLQAKEQSSSTNTMAIASNSSRDLLDLIPDRGNRTDPVLSKEESALLVEEIGLLSEKYRAPLVLCYWEGQTTEQAAAQLNWPVGTFKSRLAKGREVLRHRLSRRGLAVGSVGIIALWLAEPVQAEVPPSLIESTTQLISRSSADLPAEIVALTKEPISMRTKCLFAIALLGLMGLLGLTIQWSLAQTSKPTESKKDSAKTPILENDKKWEETLLVVNQRDASTTLIDLQTGKIRATIHTGTCPHEVAVSPSGKLASVADYGRPFGTKFGNSIAILDVVNGKAIKTIDLKDFIAPHAMIWLSEEKLLCTSEKKMAIIEIDVSNGKVTGNIPTRQQGTHMIAVSGDQKRLYSVNGGSHSVSVFDLAKKEKIQDIQVGHGSEGVALSPDGAWLWVGNRQDGTLSVIDTKQLKEVKTVDCEGGPFRIAFTPNGKTALVSLDSGELGVFDVATMKESKRIKFVGEKIEFKTPGPPPGPAGLVVSADGKKVYCTVFFSSAVAVVDLEKAQVVEKYSVGEAPDGIGLSRIASKK